MPFSLPIIPVVIVIALVVLAAIIIFVWRKWLGKCGKCGHRAITTTKYYAGGGWEPIDLVGIRWKCRRCGHEYSWRD